MRGAVLAFGQRAPHNKNAISIAFGDTGYSSTLARVFGRVSVYAHTHTHTRTHTHTCTHAHTPSQVALLNFSPDYNSCDEVVSVTQYRTSTVRLVFPETILSSHTKEVNQVRPLSMATLCLVSGSLYCSLWRACGPSGWPPGAAPHSVRPASSWWGPFLKTRTSM